MSETAASRPDNTFTGTPLDLIEEIADDNDWMSSRQDDSGISIQVPGSWSDYSLFFAWNDTAVAIHFTCAFEMRVQPEILNKINGLLALINEEMWLGHFGIWSKEGLPIFRHALPLRGTNGPRREQIEDMVETAIGECDRFYPAFQHVIWGGKTPSEAIKLALIDTVGEA